MSADEAGLRAQRESMLLRRAERAIARKNTQFIIDHQNDTLEDLTEYLKGCMQSLGMFRQEKRSSARRIWNTASAPGQTQSGAFTAVV